MSVQQRRATSAIPPRASAAYQGRVTQHIDTEHQSTTDEQRRNHWLTPVMFGCLFVLGVVIVWNMVIVPWWTNLTDQYHYGDSRIIRTRLNVGHGGQDEFLSFDNNGQITVIDIPQGHIEKTHIYVVANLINNQESKLVTLHVSDINNDSRPDLVIQVEGESNQYVLFGDANGTFSSLPPK
jgi:hypothetical protein